MALINVLRLLCAVPAHENTAFCGWDVQNQLLSIETLGLVDGMQNNRDFPLSHNGII